MGPVFGIASRTGDAFGRKNTLGLPVVALQKPTCETSMASDRVLTRKPLKLDLPTRVAIERPSQTTVIGISYLINMLFLDLIVHNQQGHESRERL